MPRIRRFGRRSPVKYAREERFGGTEAAVRAVDGRGVDLDQNLVVLRDRPLDVFEPQDLRRPVPVVDDGSHEAHFLSSLRGARWIGPPWLQARPAR